jgi:hypothetical protein
MSEPRGVHDSQASDGDILAPPFVGRVVKRGRSYMVTIPKYNVRAGLVVPDALYEFTIKAAPERQQGAESDV